MKSKKKSQLNQRNIIERKIRTWIPAKYDKAPPSGWIKAIREALGINTRQLADLLEVDQSAIVRLEKRESEGKVTLELLSKVARAMDCKLVYAIIPDDQHSSLDDILEDKAGQLAKQLAQSIQHSMRLEAQGVDAETTEKQMKNISQQLKISMSKQIWDKLEISKKITRKNKKK